MLMDARRRHFLPWSLLYGFMFIVITLSLGSSTIKIIEEKGFPTVYALLLISSFVIIMIIGIVGAFVIRRNWLKYDPNKKVLQGRTAPTETHLTQISFRPGRLLEPAIETLKDENRDA